MTQSSTGSSDECRTARGSSSGLETVTDSDISRDTFKAGLKTHLFQHAYL